MITFKCINCGVSLVASDDSEGQRKKCSGCGFFCTVPDRVGSHTGQSPLDRAEYDTGLHMDRPIGDHGSPIALKRHDSTQDMDHKSVNCFFCRKNTAHGDSAFHADMHKIIRKENSFSGFIKSMGGAIPAFFPDKKVFYVKKTVIVPRCPECKAAHKGSRWRTPDGIIPESNYLQYSTIKNLMRRDWSPGEAPEEKYGQTLTRSYSEQMDDIRALSYSDIGTSTQVGDGKIDAPSAFLALVCGILSVGMPLIGLLFGLLALESSRNAIRYIEKHPEIYQGKGLAVAGKVLGWLGILGNTIFLILLLWPLLRK